jgi:ribosomal protein S18 acetylase RimI-like enzyme
MVEMALTDLDGLKPVTPPEGYELRAVKTDADMRAVYNANKEIYRGQFGFSQSSEEDYREFLRDIPDSSLWKVLWHGDDIAGFVLSKVDGATAEIMEVSVVSAFRRQGLGTYLMHESILSLKERGVSSVRLHTGSEGKMGGRQLYESLGFSPLKVHNRYRKKI